MSTWIARVYRERRLDHNPLRRPSDRAETLIGIWLLVLFAVVAPLVAHTAATTTEHVAGDMRTTELATSRQVTATTEQKATAAIESTFALIETSWVTATWTAPEGTPRTAQIQVDAGLPRGSRQRIWVTSSGDPTAPPLPASQISQLGELAAMVGLLVVIAVFLSIAIVLRLAFRRRRSAAIDAEWAAAEPRWNRQRW